MSEQTGRLNEIELWAVRNMQSSAHGAASGNKHLVQKFIERVHTACKLELLDMRNIGDAMQQFTST
jgi:hypothetical protein